ncbi:MAG: hypothetical protein WDO18_10815 [Acidobacteriota bacterium]
MARRACRRWGGDDFDRLLADLAVGEGLQALEPRRPCSGWKTSAGGRREALQSELTAAGGGSGCD